MAPQPYVPAFSDAKLTSTGFRFADDRDELEGVNCDDFHVLKTGKCDHTLCMTRHAFKCRTEIHRLRELAFTRGYCYNSVVRSRVVIVHDWKHYTTMR